MDKNTKKYNNNEKLYNNSLALPFYTSILTNILFDILFRRANKCLIVCKGDAMQCERMYIEKLIQMVARYTETNKPSQLFLTVYVAFCFIQQNV